jgi:hypothetical protein
LVGELAAAAAAKSAQKLIYFYFLSEEEERAKLAADGQDSAKASGRRLTLLRQIIHLCKHRLDNFISGK